MGLNTTYTLLAYKEIASSLSQTFMFRWELRLASKTTQTTKYYIYTYLKWIGGNPGTPSLIAEGRCPATGSACVNNNPTTFLEDVETLARMQHNWHICYTIDGALETKYLVLPDNNAKAGVVQTGHLHMKKNEWYQWGPPKTGTWANDGKKHTVRVTMHMDEFGYPWNCPKAGSEASAQLTVTMPQYAITPGKPKAVVSGAWYEHRVTWAAVTNAKDYRVQRKVGNGSWTNVTGWITSRSYTPSNHFEFEPGTSISYRVVARSSTGTTATGAATPAFNIGGGVKIKVNGVWKSGTVYIKVNGVWRRADYIATKQNDSWKISAY